MFLFCCFTGLRYSDVAKLKKTDVKDGYLNVITQKAVDGLRIELNKHSQAILNKYKNKTLLHGLALPVISNTKMNAHLKNLGQLVGLDEPTQIVFSRKRSSRTSFPKMGITDNSLWAAYICYYSTATRNTKRNNHEVDRTQ